MTPRVSLRLHRAAHTRSRASPLTQKDIRTRDHDHGLDCLERLLCRAALETPRRATRLRQSSLSESESRSPIYSDRGRLRVRVAVADSDRRLVFRRGALRELRGHACQRAVPALFRPPGSSRDSTTPQRALSRVEPCRCVPRPASTRTAAATPRRRWRLASKCSCDKYTPIQASLLASMQASLQTNAETEPSKAISTPSESLDGVSTPLAKALTRGARAGPAERGARPPAASSVGDAAVQRPGPRHPKAEPSACRAASARN